MEVGGGGQRAGPPPPGPLRPPAAGRGGRLASGAGAAGDHGDAAGGAAGREDLPGRGHLLPRGRAPAPPTGHPPGPTPGGRSPGDLPGAGAGAAERPAASGDLRGGTAGGRIRGALPGGAGGAALRVSGAPGELPVPAPAPAAAGGCLERVPPGWVPPASPTARRPGPVPHRHGPPPAHGRGDQHALPAPAGGGAATAQDAGVPPEAEPRGGGAHAGRAAPRPWPALPAARRAGPGHKQGHRVGVGRGGELLPPQEGQLPAHAAQHPDPHFLRPPGPPAGALAAALPGPCPL
nr:translation initiation factor IF-2-like [Caretta caretta]